MFFQQKYSPWEGASRNLGVIYSPLINQKQRIFDGYFHTNDILPTLASAAGIKISAVDGFDQWAVLMNGGKSPRNEVVTSLDNVDGYSGIIVGNWKLVNGTTMGGIYDDYLGSIQEFPMSPESYSKLVLSSRVGKALTDKNSLKVLKVNLTPAKIQILRKKSQISCNEADNPIKDETKCNPLKSPCLFNIFTDPCERKNLAELFPETLRKLTQRMKDLVKTAAAARRIPYSDPECNPEKHNGTWNWWVADI
jgi:arylsulfatase B